MTQHETSALDKGAKIAAEGDHWQYVTHTIIRHFLPTNFGAQMTKVPICMSSIAVLLSAKNSRGDKIGSRWAL
jgi:hypothetical protein